MPDLPAGLSPHQIKTIREMVLCPDGQSLLRDGSRIGIDVERDGEFVVIFDSEGLLIFDDGKPVCPNAKWYSYESVPGVIDHVPTSFDLSPHAGRWFHWSEVVACFWPGRGGRAENVNPDLAPVRHMGGVYCLAWSAASPNVIGPKAPAVRYVGETSNFRRRMGQFGNSAGFWGERSNGHSAGWRWPEGQTEQTWVSFFPVGDDLQPHLGAGMRLWMEAVALEEYRLAFGRLPDINQAVNPLERFET